MSTMACYVTGTDTGIGKSVVSAALLHALRARGQRAVGMKPVASGCERTPQGWRNEDALALQAASDPRPVYEDINPYALPQPLAPELAAAVAGVTIALPTIVSAYARLRSRRTRWWSKAWAAGPRRSRRRWTRSTWCGRWSCQW